MPLKTDTIEEPNLNLTPMIDIVFLLIIFFMVGTKFSELEEQERKIPLQVPQIADEGAPLSAAPEPKVINVYRNGRITLDDEDVTLEELTQKLAAACRQYEQLGVLVRGDRWVYYQHVVDVVSACNRAGVKRRAIAVLRKQQEN